MTPSHSAPTTIASRRRVHRTASFSGGALAAFALLLAPAAAPATAAATTTAGSPRSLFGQPNAEPAHAIAHISAADEVEIERATEAAEAAEEAAASAEAEAEEAAEDATEAKAEAEEAASGARPGTDVVLSDLKLTGRASTMLRHRQPVASAVTFSFTLSAPATVSVTLVKQTDVEGHTRWVPLPNSLTLPAAKGQDHSSLKGHDRLSPGRYRLTVKPAGGRSRSIYLNVNARA
ncbi:MAG TPA: hypothetical protein VGL54_09175 [Solirubrobacteraceae bacterium]|jgi:hypothetical protein